MAVALVLPAIAAATCDMSGRESDPGQYGTTYNIHDGGGSGYFSYVKSNILVKDPVLAPSCATYICLSYSWEMMVSSSLNTWAQWGPGEGYLDGYPWSAGTAFVQCYGASGLYDDSPTVSSVGSNPLYTIHYGTDPLLQSGNKIELINGTIYDWCGGGGRNPFTFTPKNAQIATEIADQKTQVPGTVPNHETFSNSVAIDPTAGSQNFFTGGSWGYIDSNTPASFIGANIVNSSTLDEWDKDCGS
jgi:hypothetical protein